MIMLGFTGGELSGTKQASRALVSAGTLSGLTRPCLSCLRLSHLFSDRSLSFWTHLLSASPPRLWSASAMRDVRRSKRTHGHDMGHLKKGRKRKIKAIPRFRRLCGHDMEDQFGQELGRGTVYLRYSRKSSIYLSGYRLPHVWACSIYLFRQHIISFWRSHFPLFTAILQATSKKCQRDAPGRSTAHCCPD